MKKKSNSNNKVKESYDDVENFSNIPFIDIKELKTINFFGVSVWNIKREGILALIWNSLDKKKLKSYLYICLLDPLKFLHVYRKDVPTKVLQNTAFLPSGAALQWTSRLLKDPFFELAYPLSLFTDLVRLANKFDYTIALLSDNTRRLDKAHNHLRKAFPSVRFIAQHNIRDQKRMPLIKESLWKSTPDLIILDLPYNEELTWISENHSTLPKSIVVGITGIFHVFSRENYLLSNWLYKSKYTWLKNTLLAPWRLKQLFFAAYYFFFVVSKILSRNFLATLGWTRKKTPEK